MVIDRPIFSPLQARALLLGITFFGAIGLALLTMGLSWVVRRSQGRSRPTFRDVVRLAAFFLLVMLVLLVIMSRVA